MLLSLGKPNLNSSVKILSRSSSISNFGKTSRLFLTGLILVIVAVFIVLIFLNFVVDNSNAGIWVLNFVVDNSNAGIWEIDDADFFCLTAYRYEIHLQAYL